MIIIDFTFFIPPNTKQTCVLIWFSSCGSQPWFVSKITFLRFTADSDRNSLFHKSRHHQRWSDMHGLVQLFGRGDRCQIKAEPSTACLCNAGIMRAMFLWELFFQWHTRFSTSTPNCAVQHIGMSQWDSAAKIPCHFYQCNVGHNGIFHLMNPHRWRALWLLSSEYDYPKKFLFLNRSLAEIIVFAANIHNFSPSGVRCLIFLYQRHTAGF